MSPGARKKLYCYVDETGQDDTSSVFVVVAVVSDENQDELRHSLLQIEDGARTGNRKWHKSHLTRRIKYLNVVIDKSVAAGSIFFGAYPKPLPYFFPFVDVLERAIKTRASGSYSARVYVDGIDRKKAGELTNALRMRGVTLDLVKSRRDESEPLIRLADMWAGCIRAASRGSAAEQQILKRALDLGRVAQLPVNASKEKTP
jgi:hypothetical protein